MKNLTSIQIFKKLFGREPNLKDRKDRHALCSACFILEEENIIQCKWNDDIGYLLNNGKLDCFSLLNSIEAGIEYYDSLNDSAFESIDSLNKFLSKNKSQVSKFDLCTMAGGVLYIQKSYYLPFREDFEVYLNLRTPNDEKLFDRATKTIEDFEHQLKRFKEFEKKIKNNPSTELGNE